MKLSQFKEIINSLSDDFLSRDMNIEFYSGEIQSIIGVELSKDCLLFQTKPHSFHEFCLQNELQMIDCTDSYRCGNVDFDSLDPLIEEDRETNIYGASPGEIDSFEQYLKGFDVFDEEEICPITVRSSR